MTICYVVIIDDRHDDPDPHVFTTAEKAIDYARREAHARLHGDHDTVTESDEDGCLYYATYCVEGDSVFVVERTVDEETL